MLQVLMPMGGLGQRFRNAGFATPKPLIPVDGVPMFRRALASFAPYPGERSLTVVVRQDDDERNGISALIREADPAATIVPLTRDTRGAVESALEARDVLDPAAPLVVMDCDIAFVSPDYFSTIDREPAFDGVLLSFASSEPRYSYVEVDTEGLAVRTAEKDPISRHALMGAYYFRRADLFFEAGDRLMARQISQDMKEYYMSLAFNELITSGRRVAVASGDFFCFGTPEELEYYRATGNPVADG